MTAEVQVACCQFAPDVERPEATVAATRQSLGAALKAGAKLVILPELATSGYVFRTEQEARDAATPADGEVLAGWAQEIASGGGDALVVGGFCELGADGRLFNSCALVDRDGVQAVYRKVHLWGEEPRWFAPGDACAPVIETALGRIGLAVCYDLEFPELTRGLALDGADLIALPTNWPREPAPAGAVPVLQTLALATAYLSKVFVAICDRCGTERGLQFEGGSLVAGPDGSLRAGPVPDRGVATLHVRCALGATRHKRNGEHNDAFADRRPELYGLSLDRPRER